MELKTLFNKDVWKRAITFRTKTDKLDNLYLKCPICNLDMSRFKNYGLNFEEKIFGVCPYYCEECKKKGDYPIYNVTWRSEEAKLTMYAFMILVVWCVGYAIIKLLKFAVANLS